MAWIKRWITLCAVIFYLAPSCFAAETCYPAGGVAGIVIATIVVTIVVMCLGFVAGWRVWRRRKTRKKQTEANHKPTAENIPGDFAFDNPYFRDPEEEDNASVQQGKTRTSINNKSPLRSSKLSDLSSKGRKVRSSRGHHFIFGGGGPGKKQRALDDTYVAAEPERTVVSLKGHDFTGLGFNICGNMRDGILVKDVLHRGPASESGKIKAGDRIISVTVSFTNIVYEDALTILSYASPYDVQLELERTSDKSRDAQTSPSVSKRLGSGSFSGGGQKLFHPLYRSQSIDDLTQIDKDTFPSPGFGPRRSQSVGVAAHKLAAHFKNSDTRLEEKERPSASVILSTTGSLNEKMLANVMADGALHKSGGLHWEKRFEDTLENEPPVEGDSKQETASVPKTSVSSANDDKSDISDSRSPAANKLQEGGNRGSESQKESQSFYAKGSNDRDNSETRTRAQVHYSDELRERRAQSVAEASNAIWNLDQSIREAESDMDSASSHQSWKNLESRRSSLGAMGKHVVSRVDVNDDSDVSGDSLEGENKRKRKKTRRKSSSSLGDASQIEKVAGRESNCLDSKSGPVDANKERQQSSTKAPNQQKVLKRCLKSESNSCREQSAVSESAHVPVSQEIERNQNVSVNESQTIRTPPSHFSNSSLTQMSSKDKRMERTVISTSHSPKLSIKSSKPKPDPYSIHNESAYQKSDHYQTAPYVSPQHVIIEESSRMHLGRPNDRSYYAERHDLGSPRTASPQYHGANQSMCDPDDNRNRFPPHHYQQRAPCHYQKQVHQRNVPEDEMKRNGPPPYHQAIRKAANPAGMFTQINPFQQPSRQRNNVAGKPWMVRDEKNSPIPVNGNDAYYQSYPKQMQVTTIDSSGCARVRTHPDPQSYPQKYMDSGHSKTVLISTFDNTNCPPPMNYRQIRK